MTSLFAHLARHNRHWMIAVTMCFLASCAHSPAFDEQRLPNAPLVNHQITLNELTLTPSSYWLREKEHQYSKGDIDELMTRYKKLFQASFESEMAEAGWQMRANATYSATLDIQNFRVSAPDIKGPMVDQFVKDELGYATLTLSLFDGNNLVAKFVDRRIAPTIVPGKLEPANRVTNQQAMKRMLTKFLKDANAALTPAFQSS